MDPEEHQKLVHLLACGVDPREAEVVAAGLRETQAARGVREWIASGRTFCLLLGTAGGGKTVAAAEVLLEAKLVWDGGREWAYSPMEAKFVVASDLARLSYFEIEAQRRLGRLERVPWLVLDDLGSELMTPGWVSNLGELFLRRNSQRQRTVITSNLSPEKFRERYDERILSRIKGDGMVIGAGDVDLRRVEPPRLAVVKPEAAPAAGGAP